MSEFRGINKFSKLKKKMKKNKWNISGKYYKNCNLVCLNSFYLERKRKVEEKAKSN